MDIQSFDEIVKNDDVMLLIFNQLLFEDQLRLAGTSLRLKKVFENYIWAPKYSTLKIYSRKLGFIVTNETCVNRILLSAEQLQEFLKFYADDIQELQLFNAGIKIDFGQFKHLTKLRYVWNQNPDKHLQLIAKNFPNLEYLEFYQDVMDEEYDMSEEYDTYEEYDDMNEEYGKNITVDNLDVKNFLEIKNLKNLIISNKVRRQDIKYRDLLEVIAKLKLVYFYTDYYLDTENTASTVSLQHLQELVITFYCFDLPLVDINCEHLSILTVKIYGDITEEFLIKLAETCKNLKKLKIDATDFNGIKTFHLAPNVTDLNIGNSPGLTYLNLKQLLTETGLTQFCHTSDIKEGEYDDFVLSPLIQELELYFNAKILKSLIGKVNLKKLTMHYSGDIFIDTDNSLASCINLETLNIIYRCPIKLDTILQFENLHNLSINLPSEDQVSFIIALLKHRSLTALELLNSYNIIELNVEGLERLQGFTTNITNLKVQYEIFESSLDFWLDLFSRNITMCLECNEHRYGGINIMALRRLVNNKRYPKSLKTIEVFGFTIRCKDLRSAHNHTLQNIIDDLTDDAKRALALGQHSSVRNISNLRLYRKSLEY